MASPIIHINRLVTALAENEGVAIPTRTIIDGALRPLTAKQRKELQDLVAFPASLANAKELHQRKIQKTLEAVAYEAGIKIEKTGNVFGNVKVVVNE